MSAIAAFPPGWAVVALSAQSALSGALRCRPGSVIMRGAAMHRSRWRMAMRLCHGRTCAGRRFELQAVYF